jgi:peptidoglycan/LPS O-acetylase OafA/YrhL
VDRYRSLDGWRGVSISLVLLGHLFPMGPSNWLMNESVAASGMVIFFILSGFLITNMLFRNQSVGHFFVRRFCRIIPLAWLVMLVSFLAWKASISVYLPHFLFFANIPPMALTEYTSHLWSLCVEVQFYILVGILVFAFKKRGLYFLPLLCVAITAFRACMDVKIAINTYYRLDEILAGAILALIYNNDLPRIKAWIAKLSPIYLFPLLLLSAHQFGGYFNFARPYVAFLLIGSTLFSGKANRSIKILDSKILVYLATVSYALYVFHGVLRFTWLGSGDTLEKYLKRPLLLLATFGLAHVSTFIYEKRFILLGKMLIDKDKRRKAASEV